MREIRSPETYHPCITRYANFVAGAIDGCEDWQTGFIQSLSDLDIDLINPRRHDYPKGDPKAANFQVEWEFHNLYAANTISFWMPEGAMCKTTLFELGAWANSYKDIFVGVQPGFHHRGNVIRQMSHFREKLVIAETLDELAEQVRSYYQKKLRW